MTTRNEPWRHDLVQYRKQALRGAVGLLIILLLATIATACIGLKTLSNLLLGGLLGSTLASFNVFVLAYAMHGLVIKKAGSGVLVWPLLFFLILSGAALVSALFYPSICLGFAVGLTGPLVLGALIAYASTRPA